MISDDESLQEVMRERYPGLHPLVLRRSLERARDLHELFEILESVPKKPPFSWDEPSRRWKRDADISSKKKLKKMLSRK